MGFISRDSGAEYHINELSFYVYSDGKFLNLGTNGNNGTKYFKLRLPGKVQYLWLLPVHSIWINGSE